jgi:hypothetical protein
LSSFTLDDPVPPTDHNDSGITDERPPGTQNPSHLKQGIL